MTNTNIFQYERFIYIPISSVTTQQEISKFVRNNDVSLPSFKIRKSQV